MDRKTDRAGAGIYKKQEATSNRSRSRNTEGAGKEAETLKEQEKEDTRSKSRIMNTQEARVGAEAGAE